MTQKSVLLTLLGLGAAGGGFGGALYLSQDKTMKDRLNREGFRLASTDDEYEVAFKELKETDTFINDLKQKTSTLEKNSDLTTGGKALKKWCDENLLLNLSEENTKSTLPKIKNYCKERPTTIESKLTKGLVSDWKEKLKALKAPADGQDNATLISDLSVENLNDEETVSEKLASWCKDKIKTKINKDVNDEIKKKVKARCLAS